MSASSVASISLPDDLTLFLTPAAGMVPSPAAYQHDLLMDAASAGSWLELYPSAASLFDFKGRPVLANAHAQRLYAGKAPSVLSDSL